MSYGEELIVGNKFCYLLSKAEQASEILGVVLV